MKKRYGILVLFMGVFLQYQLFAQDEGDKLFHQVCVACHTIGKGRLVGPDLANVHLRHSEEWIIKFVQSSQTVIKSGDPVATALFEKYKIVMPDNHFTPDQIRSIIAYIASNSPGGPGAAQSGGVSSAQGRPIREATQENIATGGKLFVGKIRLANRGPSCNSCHHVQNDNVLAGGSLAFDLTEAYTRLGEAGIKAILANPPFPAMRQAFTGKPLTEEEIFNLTAFLQHIDSVKQKQQGKNLGVRLAVSGFSGAIVLLFLFGGVWIRTKRSSVNQKIYERQIKSD